MKEQIAALNKDLSDHHDAMLAAGLKPDTREWFMSNLINGRKFALARGILRIKIEQPTTFVPETLEEHEAFAFFGL